MDNSRSAALDPYTDNVNFTNDLLAAGFAVSIMEYWLPWLIESADVLILQYSGASFNSTEVDLLEDWVSRGGGLFVLSEFGTLGNNLDSVTNRFGFVRNTSALVSDSDDWEDYDRYVYYTVPDNLANHSATLGCARVDIAGSGAFASIPEHAVPLIVSDMDGTAGWYNTSYDYQGVWNGSIIAAASTYGMGRVEVILDTTTIDNLNDWNGDGLENYFEYDNDVFSVNSVRWLYGAGIEEKTVLFDESHGSWGPTGYYSSLAIMLTLNGFNVKRMTTFYSELVSQCDVLIIIDGSLDYTVDEISAIEEFVAEGGSLFLTGDTTTLSDKVYDVANEFGIVYNNTHGYLVETDDYDTYDAYIVYNQSNFANHPIMEGVYRMEFDLCTAFTTVGAGTALVVSDDDGTVTWSSDASPAAGLAMAAATTHAKGRVVAITDINMPSTFWNPEGDPYPNMLDADNDVFLANIFIWLTENRAPTVEVTAPDGGEVLVGETSITWSADDFDNDPLSFTVFYSDDGGGGWTQLATGLTSTSLLWDTTQVANGTDYLIRVQVTDGLETAEDVSDAPFTVDNPPPTTTTTTSTTTGFPLDTTTIIIIIAAAGGVLIIIIIIMMKKKK
jgi:hypothetical protein